MKRFILIIISIFFVFSKINAQNPNTEIIGQWKVIGFQLETEGLTKIVVQKATELKTSFLKSKFFFNSDKNFSFEIEIKDIQVKNGHWKYSQTSKSFIIQEWKDKNKGSDILMEIIVENKDGKVFFLLPETPFILEVQKVN